MNIKQNMRTKIQQMNTDIFLNQILLESIDIVNRKLVFIQMKMTMLKDLKLDRIIDNYNIIINEKNFYDLAIDSGMNRYEEIRKLTTGQGEEYATTGCLSDYDYVKNQYRLIVIDLSRLKELDADSKAIQQKEFVEQLKNQIMIINNVESVFVLTILEK